MDSQLCLNVFTREMEQHDNPHLTFETLVLRLLKRVSHSFHLPWSHVLEVSRQAPYLMDPHLHQDLLHIWTLRSKQATLDEQHCVERILGRDNVRSSDLIKLASILQKISDPKSVRILCHGRLPGRGSQEIYRPVSLRGRRGAWQTRPSRPSVVSLGARADPSRMSILFGKYF
ncbi:uncharacterized protein TNCT_384701 [Trichonephila clavata]|uniref:Uncharacterized protein n=1 Tax=Trichonephila clavata TaxID=2740835 RepID=A0A8X6L3B2_TRICU|nr:uncharacterized protein TNCT_384701 [Trichonephila clavata]